MKKVALLLVTALLISGVVWAQNFVPFTPVPAGGAAVLPQPVLSGFDGNGLFDRGNVFPSASTEYRYSAGIFDSMIDNYLDVNFCDPKIGNYAFLGGYPSGASIDNTPYPPYALNFGLGKTFKSFYLGVYYGGSLVDQTNQTSGAYAANGTDKASTNSLTFWDNNLAVLVGVPGFGAFRLDFSLSNTTAKDTYDGDVTAKIRQNAPLVALTWGGVKLAGMDPYITVGYKFADQYIYGITNPSYKQMTGTENAALMIQAGLNYDITDNSSVWGDLVFMSILGTKISGDRDAWNAYGGLAPLTGSGNSFSITSEGAWALGFRLYYKQTFDVGKVSFGFKPRLALAYGASNMGSYSGDIAKVDAPTNSAFELQSGLNLGVKFQANRVFAFYTGASLTLFDWMTNKTKGGSGKYDYSSWSFDGISWNQDQFTSASSLGFGMTITPVNNLVIGTGLNTILDKIFTIDLAHMAVGTPSNTTSLWGYNSNNAIGQLLGVFRGLNFDLTVAYKF